MPTLHLDNLLNPRSIVVVGASGRENSPGYLLAKNLHDNEFRGTLHFVNPRYETLFGRPCHRSVKSLPMSPDLALIITPPALDKRVLTECAEMGIRVAAMMSPRPRPQGPVSRSQEDALCEFAWRLGIRIVGPYCEGVIRPAIGLNGTYATNPVKPGSLAVISQSGSLGAAVIDWSVINNIGFSALYATGAEADVSVADILDMLAEDPATRAIVVYLESFRETRHFLSALSAASRYKPVIVMSSGQASAPYCDALARTGTVHSSEAVLQMALQRAGAVRIRSFGNLFAASRLLGAGLRIKGRRVAIVSNGRAPATLALEQLPQKGLRAAEVSLSPSIFTPREQLNLPPRVDVPDADIARPTASDVLDKAMRTLPEAKAQFGRRRREVENPLVLRNPYTMAIRYREAADALLADPDVNAVLIILAPNTRTDPTDVARELCKVNRKNKPLLTCLMGGALVGEARQILAEAGLPYFETPESATSALDFLHRHHVGQRQLLELARAGLAQDVPDYAAGQARIDATLARNANVLAPKEARGLLSDFHIPVLDMQLVRNVDEAVAAADNIGYPVAMKVVGQHFSYKSSLVPTQLNLRDENAVRSTWEHMLGELSDKGFREEVDAVLIEAMLTDRDQRELAISLRRDATFGPVISIGIGGELTPLMQKLAVQLPPLTSSLIDEMLDEEPLQVWFGSYRHKSSVPVDAVRQILLQVSEIACEYPEIQSLDINPLIVSRDRAVAVDMQIAVHKAKRRPNHGHLAIPPYPREWERTFTLKNGQQALIRPVRPEDGEGLRALVRSMSQESRYFRFMHAINELSPQMTAQFTKLDYDRQIAFVAEPLDAPGDIMGVSRYTLHRDGLRGEFALSIGDAHQGLGLGTLLMQRLIEYGEANEIEQLEGSVLRNNEAMLKLMHRVGFERHFDPDNTDTYNYIRQLQTGT